MRWWQMIVAQRTETQNFLAAEVSNAHVYTATYVLNTRLR